MNVINDLFDDHDDLSKNNLDKQIRDLLNGKEVNRKEIIKDGKTIIEESFNDGSLKYYSKTIVTTNNLTSNTQENSLKDLNKRLNEAVQRENYEEAAKLRDKIKELKTSF